MSDLLPPNATSAERALAQTVGRISSIPTPVRDVWDPDTCPAPLLPWLAWAFSVDQWDSGWTETQKRDTIRAAVAVQRYKGTIGAVRDSIAALGIACQVQEWFNQSPPGAPYTFRLILDADQDGITLAQMAKLLDVVASGKNLRSHLDTVVPGVTSEARLYVGAVAQTGHEISVNFGGGGLVFDGSFVAGGVYNSNGLPFPA
jgi:phage tail P2-like protein